jgi:hypothetical protein
MIDSYSFGKFVIGKKEYKSNITIINGKAQEHRYLPDHELKLDDVLPLINAKPSCIIIGIGAYGVMKVPKEISEYIEKQGIKLIIEKTGAACKKYEELAKKTKVAALLHNTC